MPCPMDNTLQSSGPRYARLTPEQCAKLHNASLEILERTGIRFYDQGAIDLVRQAGAQVSDDNQVRLPARLVEQALSTAPRRVTL